MGIQFFGEFLIDRWVITRGQLLEALELQDYRNSRFGDIAVKKGFLTEQQATQVNHRQRSTDRRFGDLAMEMGFLTEEQVRAVVTQQKNSYLYLGESLLELGHVTEDILERELAIFEEEQAAYALEQVPVPAGVAAAMEIATAVDITRKMFLRVPQIVAKVGDAAILDGGLGAGRDRDDVHLTIAVLTRASVLLTYVLSVSSEVAVRIASAILGEDATRESEELVEDAVGEFCNIVCGNVAAKLAQQGIEMEIEPPHSIPAGLDPEAEQQLVHYPLGLSVGSADLHFLVPKASTQA